MATLSAQVVLGNLREKWRGMQRIAQDVEVSESDLRIITAAHRGPRELLPLRLELLGLDPGFVRSALTATYRDLERKCAMCTAWRRCTRDLATGDAQAGMDTYCLNSEAIDALTVDQRGRNRRDVRA